MSRRRQVRQQALDDQPAIAIAIDGLLERLNLQLGVLNDLHVGFGLRGKLTRMLRPVHLEPRLLLRQSLARVIELALQKLIRALGELRPLVDVLFDEERGEPLGDRHDLPRVVAHVAHPERITLDDVDIHVQAHLLHDILHGAGAALVHVQVVVEDDPLEPRAAHDLLADGVEPVLDLGCDRRPHVALGHTLRHDEHQRVGTILIGQEVGDDRHP